MTRRAILVTLSAFVLSGALGVWLIRPPTAGVPERGVSLSGVTLVNPGSERLENRSIGIRGNRIDRIEPTEAGQTGPYRGATVLPGLIDLHVHHPPVVALGERQLFALLFLAYGVTSVRDVGVWLPATLRRHRDRIAAGKIPGPRIFQCGSFVDGERSPWPGTLTATDESSGRAAVNSLADSGADCIKIYNDLNEAAVRGILAAAAQRRLPVVGHLPWRMSLYQLKNVEIQHLMGVGVDWEDLRKSHLLRYARWSHEHELRHTPTLVAFARLAGAADSDAWRDDPAVQWLPRYYRDVLWRLDRNPLARVQFEEDGGASSQRLRAMKLLVGMLHREGGTVLAGTDVLNPGVVPGAALHEELRQLVDAGLSPEEAWAAATRLAGEALGRPELGILEPGAPADLLVFRDDPTQDLKALSSLEAVVADGRLYSRASLDEALERARAHFAGFPYEPASLLAARVTLAWLGTSDR